jgi:hypothetical protein
MKQLCLEIADCVKNNELIVVKLPFLLWYGDSANDSILSVTLRLLQTSVIIAKKLKLALELINLVGHLLVLPQSLLVQFFRERKRLGSLEVRKLQLQLAHISTQRVALFPEAHILFVELAAALFGCLLY